MEVVIVNIKATGVSSGHTFVTHYHNKGCSNTSQSTMIVMSLIPLSSLLFSGLAQIGQIHG